MSKRIYVMGGTGLIGTALQKIMPDAIYLGSKDCDLTNQQAVINLFCEKPPHTLIHLSARVGGWVAQAGLPPVPLLGSTAGRGRAVSRPWCPNRSSH